MTVFGAVSRSQATEETVMAYGISAAFMGAVGFALVALVYRRQRSVPTAPETYTFPPSRA
jgi:hypothetical protein